MFIIQNFGIILLMNIYKTVVISDSLIGENIKEVRIKRVDICDLSVGCNIIIDFFGFKRPYTIAEFDDYSIVIIVKNQLQNIREILFRHQA